METRVTCPPKTNPKDKLGLGQKGGKQNAKEVVYIRTDHNQTSRSRSSIEPGHDRNRGGEKAGNQRRLADRETLLLWQVIELLKNDGYF